uniref:Protein SPT2 homolog n=1 Tax=Caenorhabditis tropicalis TaxID=1561998 RepID=A0A1I7UHW4_9PELO
MLTMYQLVLYNVIYIGVLWLTIVNCLKGVKREKGESKKTLKKPPIVYETDPEVQRKETRQKIVENREKMQKKRQKPIEKTTDDVKETAKAKQKTKEKEITVTPSCQLSEDSTQPSNSEDSVKTAHPPPQIIPLKDKFCKKSNDKDKKSLSLSEEEIGDVQLINEDPYAAAKKHIIKKRAQEIARRKQVEEAVRKRQERENCSYTASPDDTLKNISSIQFESQISIIQRKRKQNKSRDGSSDETLVEPKSNELYIRDVPERVLN